MSAATSTADVSVAVTQLLRGVVYRGGNEKQWSTLLNIRNQVADYVAVIGLRVLIDEAEGYAFLKTAEAEDDSEPLPRLVARRSLSFPVSLLLALLRKKLAEFDASSSETRLMLSRSQIAELLRVFLPETSNEARLLDQIDAHVNKVVELGFLRRLPGQTDAFEVRRIIKAYVDGQWLSDFDTRLQQYREHLGAEQNEEVNG